MPKRDESHMASVRKQILDAARVVFERKGVADASMAEISTQAGLSIGTIYVHFRAKEDVLLQLIEAADVNASPFEQCTSAGELLGLVESLLKAQERPDASNQTARTALEVAAITRRNPEAKPLSPETSRACAGPCSKRWFASARHPVMRMTVRRSQSANRCWRCLWRLKLKC